MGALLAATAAAPSMPRTRQAIIGGIELINARMQQIGERAAFSMPPVEMDDSLLSSWVCETYMGYEGLCDAYQHASAGPLSQVDHDFDASPAAQASAAAMLAACEERSFTNRATGERWSFRRTSREKRAEQTAQNAKWFIAGMAVMAVIGAVVWAVAR